MIRRDSYCRLCRADHQRRTRQQRPRVVRAKNRYHDWGVDALLTKSPKVESPRSWWVNVDRASFQARVTEEGPRMQQSRFGRLVQLIDKGLDG